MDDCERFLAAEHVGLLRAAYVLTGDQHAAEDLTQETMIRIVSRWNRVRDAASPRAYARKTLMNTFLKARRRAWRGEVPHAELPEPFADSPLGSVDERDRLRRALARLPARQRAAVVLRHYEDLSEAEAAAVLGVSVGTVKSLTSRGLAGVRTAEADAAGFETGTRR